MTADKDWLILTTFIYHFGALCYSVQLPAAYTAAELASTSVSVVTVVEFHSETGKFQ